MFCDKKNVNQFTSLLLAHGIEDVVICPGSRNGVIAHNLYELGDKVNLYPVNDERSAAFVALGLCLQSNKPVVVCTTSGSALLNTLPATAEAFYRHLPLIIVSADRPPSSIGQLDGQTLFQQNALSPYAKTFQATEPSDEEESRWCNHVLNEAFLNVELNGKGPVHVNLPISEPLFTFTTPNLPRERVVEQTVLPNQNPIPSDIMEVLETASFPVLLFGQYEEDIEEAVFQIETNSSMLVLPEIIANQYGSWRMNALENDMLIPEDAVIVHVGGNLIGKKIKERLRRFDNLRVIRIQEDDQLPDTFHHLSHVVRGSVKCAVKQLADALSYKEEVRQARDILDQIKYEEWEEEEELTDSCVIKKLASALKLYEISSLHLANSLTVRNAQKYFSHGLSVPVYCNRGVNGIEGSMSVAAGYSLRDAGISLLCIGDLSFFYDANALWNIRLDGRLRIVLLNNSGGKIFQTLPGLSDSPARDEYIAGNNQSIAKGICDSYEIFYLSADKLMDLEKQLRLLLTMESERPIVLEIFIQN